MRNRGGWQKGTLEFLGQVQQILEGLRDYWPLTLRQVYYQLVAALIIENNSRSYGKVSRVLVKARLDGQVPWDALEDRSRDVLNSAGWGDKFQFIGAHLDNFLSNYRRDLLQSQAVVPEVWIEKDALSRVCHRAAEAYCVPVIVAKGFSSVSYVNECRKRVENNTKAGQRTKILYFGDLDPSGWAMLPAMLETLQGEMGLGDSVEGIRCALTPNQVDAYSLPRNPEAMKDTDTRTPKFKAMLRRERYPDTLAVELDALPPATLEALVREAIGQNLDLSQFAVEQQQEEAKRAALNELRAEVGRFVNGRV